MCHVLLIRHGSFDGMTDRLAGRAADGINTRGMGEAVSAAVACRRLRIAAVVTSPQRRAVETAAIVADRLGLAVDACASFDEIDFGEWRGRTFDELSRDPDWLAYNTRRETARIPGGERLAGVTERVHRGLTALLGAYRSRTVAVVTHAEIIRAALLLAESRSWTAWSRFDPHPGSISLVSWKDGWRTGGVALGTSALRAAIEWSGRGEGDSPRSVQAFAKPRGVRRR